MDEQKKALLDVLGTAADVVAGSNSVREAMAGLSRCLSVPASATYTNELAKCIREIARRVEGLPDASEAARIAVTALCRDADDLRDIVKSLATICIRLADHGGR